MAAQYVQKHKLAQTIERGLGEALKSQPGNPYEALAAWFKDVPAAPASPDAAAEPEPEPETLTGKLPALLASARCLAGFCLRPSCKRCCSAPA
eukprot:COSAG06_NODE_11796_length_1463_cov_8.478006_2_plen_93_part_00